MDKELEEHLKMWDGTPYSMSLVEDIYDLGYGIGKKYAAQQFKEYLEKKRENNSASCFMEEYGQGIQDGIENILEEIINEFFKED